MFDDLEAALDDTDYTPSFAPKQPVKKPMNRQPSPAASEPPALSKPYTPPTEDLPPRRSGNLLGLHKASSVESKSEERVLPNKPHTPNKAVEWDIPLPELEFRPSTRAGSNTPQQPAPIVQRGMKPPLSRKNSDKNITAIPQPLNIELSQTVKASDHQGFKMSDNELNKMKQMYEQQVRSLKDFYEKQMKNERNTFDTRLKQTKSQYQNSKSIVAHSHKEELNLKLHLKDVQIQKLKQMHQIQIQSKAEQLKQVQKLKDQGERLYKKGQIVQMWEKKLKSEIEGLSKREEERLEKARRQIELRETNVSQRERDIEIKQRQWKDDLKKQKKTIEGEYQRLQVLQQSIVKEKNKLQKDYFQRQQTIRGQNQQIKRQYQKKSQQLDLLRSNLEHEKSLLKESQAYYQKKITEFNTERQQLLKSCGDEKRLTTQKEIDLEGKLRSIIVRQSEIDYLKDELKGKSQLLQLERKRVTIELEAKQKPQFPRDNLIRTFYNKDLEDRAKKVNQQRANSVIKNQPSLNKSLTELKNQYLNGLQQLKGQGPANSSFRPFTFSHFS